MRCYGIVDKDEDEGGLTDLCSGFQQAEQQCNIGPMRCYGIVDKDEDEGGLTDLCSGFQQGK
ncbi:Hypothetical predicted protein [Olea europaea subsp. europaea]|uniref:Uncharacterized protein n=1 Tax=Olea europaea subsp. europaea TaxID=158383 RepID=A0A8S0VE96_OLEEU|nr:Hypothetical predicted protein [Olea europaea subsp. europaea]